jgi:cysteinyl-tRNA synthetase
MKLMEKLTPSEKSDENIQAVADACYAAMNDDFNTPILISHLFEGVRIINSVKDGKLKLTASDIALLSKTMDEFFHQVLGLNIEDAGANDALTEQLMNFILEMRSNAKSNKDFATSDLIRDSLAKLNIQIKDTKEGATWSINE